MKKRYCMIALFLLLCANLFAVPPSLRYHDLGWFDMSLGLTITLPDGLPNFGLHINGAGAENVGVGLSLVIGWSMLEFTFNVVGYFDFPEAPEWTVPLYFKIGFLSQGLGIGVESGLKWFFGGFSTEIAPDCGYFNGEILGGVHILLYSFGNMESIGLTPGFCFRPIPLVAAAFALAGQMPEDDGYVWIY